MKDFEEHIGKLRSSGLRPTKQRLSISKTLFDQKNRTKDLGGDSNTVECTKAVLDNL